MPKLLAPIPRSKKTPLLKKILVGVFIAVIGGLILNYVFGIGKSTPAIEQHVSNSPGSINTKNQTGGTNTVLINPVTVNEVQSQKPSQEIINSLEVGRPLDYFEEFLGQPISSKTWDYPGTSYPEAYQENIFQETLMPSVNNSSTYFVQAVTDSTQNDKVVFWSVTLCNPNATLNMIDPRSGQTITLNKSTFADIFSPANDPELYYDSTQGLILYEMQPAAPGSIAPKDGLYVGVNDTCHNLGYSGPYFNLPTSSEEFNAVSTTQGLINFRANTKINVVGIAGPGVGNAANFNDFLQRTAQYEQSSMGVDLTGLSDGIFQ
jgi:hypothetical protein